MIARVAARCALAIAVCCGCGVDDGGPRLAAVSPSSAARGAQVTVTGARLCRLVGATCKADRVTLGLSLPMVDAMVASESETTIVLLVPDLAPAGAAPIVVTVDGRSSNALDFTVDP